MNEGNLKSTLELIESLESKMTRVVTVFYLTDAQIDEIDEFLEEDNAGVGAIGRFDGIAILPLDEFREGPFSYSSHGVKYEAVQFGVIN